MLPGSGSAAVRAAVAVIAAVPVILLVLFVGLFGLLGLLCGREGRDYVTKLISWALETASFLMHGPAAIVAISPEIKHIKRSRSTSQLRRTPHH
jgi:hypothetical protein